MFLTQGNPQRGRMTGGGRRYGEAFSMNFNSDNIKPNVVFDGSGNQLHGVVSGATHVPTGGINGGGVYDFDGVDDYIELNDGMNITTFYVGGQDNTPSGIFVSPDGLNAYVCGTVNDSIYQYALSTAWDISTATYVRTLVSVWNVSEIAFNPAGTKLYASDDASTITQYTLSTAWDISTAVSSGTFSTAAQSTAIRGIFVRADGLKFYITENSATDTVYQYSMTGGDITTGSYDSKSFSTNAQDTSNQSISFKDDGTVMFILGDTGNNVYLYTLGTAWDVSTATYSGISFYVGSKESTPYGMCFGNNGNILYMVGGTTDTIYQYNLYSPYSFSNPIYSNGFTIIADIKADTAGEALFGRILDKSYGGNGEGGYYWTVSNNQNHTFTINNGTAISATASSVPFASTKRVAVTVTSAGAVTMYVNGASAGTGTTNTPDKITVPTVSRIGNYALGTTRTFDGYIGNVRIFSRVLTDTEIAADYAALGDARDFTGIPHLTTAMRDSIVSPPNPYQIFNLTTGVIETWNGSAWV